MKEKIKGAIMGAVVGDAVGLPFEFLNREDVRKKDIVKMKKSGYHAQPPGTWSDDSSMIFCTMESMINGYDYRDIGKMFCRWKYESYWTPYGVLFDVGGTTSYGIRRINLYNDYTGNNEENHCGNGSLMRVIPILFYIKDNRTERFKIIEEVSSLTHSNMKCIVACSIYLELCLNILDGDEKNVAYKKMQEVIKEHYKDCPDVLSVYDRILNNAITSFDKNSFSGSGYVVSTLETSIYSFMSTKTYKKAVCTAILFGEDTDTVASIVGGMAGLYYGERKIPSAWKSKICKKDLVDDLILRFSDSYR